MPKVGGMKFQYTEQGMKEAVSYAKSSGKPMQVEGNYRHGGKVPKYNLGGMVPRRPKPSPIQRPIPRPTPGTGMRPPVNPGIYRNGGMVPRPSRGGMNSNQMRALRNRLAKFKKGIV